MSSEKTKQNKQEPPGRADEMKIIYEVSMQAEALYGEAQTLGQLAADVLGKEHRSQITGLENIAETALKTSDVLDYVKRQTARHEYWRKSDFGKKLLEALDDTLNDTLKGRLKSVCDSLKINDKTSIGQQDRRKVYLLLMRQFIRQMAIQYEFKTSFKEEAGNNGTHR